MENRDFSIHTIDGIKVVNFKDVINKHGNKWFQFAKDEHYFVYKNTKYSNVLGILYNDYLKFLQTL